MHWLRITFGWSKVCYRDNFFSRQSDDPTTFFRSVLSGLASIASRPGRSPNRPRDSRTADISELQRDRLHKAIKPLAHERLLAASAMLITPGLTPVSATLGALGVVAPALVWFVQPLLSARTHRRRNCESEDYFWNFGPDG